METCSICGDNDEFSVTHTLKCGHTFHYQCLYLSFKHMKTNRCPYCRSGNHFLPLINGVKKANYSIHQIDNNFQNKKCEAIIQRGPNKGKSCGKNCHLGFHCCKSHLKQEFNKQNKLDVKT